MPPTYGPSRPKAPAARRATVKRQVPQKSKKKRRIRPRAAFLLLLCLAAGGGALTWNALRPKALLLEPPALTPEVRLALLSAVHPAWPGRGPSLPTSLGQVEATEGLVESVAAADIDGDGRPEWGVSYVWLGPPDGSGARTARPGFAVVHPGASPEVLFDAPNGGGWTHLSEGSFEDARGVETRVTAVDLGRDGAGFLQHVAAEMALGGRLSVGRTRLFAPTLGRWWLAWQAETEHRSRQGRSDEVSLSAEVVVADADGDGRAEIRLTPSRYLRRLGAGRERHFTALGPGPLIYDRRDESYVLSRIEGDNATLQVREAPPLLAVRAPGAVRIDGRFEDWNASDLAEISGFSFAEQGHLKYKRRDRTGTDDSSGDVRLMWDSEALYLRAAVLDDVVVPGPAGRELYQGDHLAVWLDRDLAGDFDAAPRSQDDWQLGFSPAWPGATAEAYAWVPKAGKHGLQVASRTLRDTYNGAARGYELEAAIPWASIGGVPTGLSPGPGPGAPTGAPSAYALRLAGAAGIALVLSDTDRTPQELVTVSSETFGWSLPRTFNTLLLVE